MFYHTEYGHTKAESHILTVYRPVSIKRPVLNFLQKSLLNVRYDRKNEGLNILSTRSYNRMVRVLGSFQTRKEIFSSC